MMHGWLLEYANITFLHVHVTQHLTSELSMSKQVKTQVLHKNRSFMMYYLVFIMPFNSIQTLKFKTYTFLLPLIITMTKINEPNKNKVNKMNKNLPSPTQRYFLNPFK